MHEAEGRRDAASCFMQGVQRRALRARPTCHAKARRSVQIKTLPLADFERQSSKRCLSPSQSAMSLARRGSSCLDAGPDAAPGSVQLANRTRDVTRAGAQSIGIETAPPLDPAGQGGFKDGSDDLLRALPGQQGDPLAHVVVGLTHSLAPSSSACQPPSTKRSSSGSPKRQR